MKVEEELVKKEEGKEEEKKVDRDNHEEEKKRKRIWTRTMGKKGRKMRGGTGAGGEKRNTKYGKDVVQKNREKEKEKVKMKQSDFKEKDQL